jgi:hypothetical protein
MITEFGSEHLFLLRYTYFKGSQQLHQKSVGETRCSELPLLVKKQRGSSTQWLCWQAFIQSFVTNTKSEVWRGLISYVRPEAKRLEGFELLNVVTEAIEDSMEGTAHRLGFLFLYELITGKLKARICPMQQLSEPIESVEQVDSCGRSLGFLLAQLALNKETRRFSTFKISPAWLPYAVFGLLSSPCFASPASGPNCLWDINPNDKSSQQLSNSEPLSSEVRYDANLQSHEFDGARDETMPCPSLFPNRKKLKERVYSTLSTSPFALAYDAENKELTKAFSNGFSIEKHLSASPNPVLPLIRALWALCRQVVTDEEVKAGLKPSLPSVADPLNRVTCVLIDERASIPSDLDCKIRQLGSISLSVSDLTHRAHDTHAQLLSSEVESNVVDLQGLGRRLCCSPFHPAQFLEHSLTPVADNGVSNGELPFSIDSHPAAQPKVAKDILRRLRADVLQLELQKKSYIRRDLRLFSPANIFVYVQYVLGHRDMTSSPDDALRLLEELEAQLESLRLWQVDCASKLSLQAINEVNNIPYPEGLDFEVEGDVASNEIHYSYLKNSPNMTIDWKDRTTESKTTTSSGPEKHVLPASSRKDYEKQIFWLTRFVGHVHSARPDLQSLVRCLLSSKFSQDLRTLNPFLSDAEVSNVEQCLLGFVLLTSCLAHSYRCLQSVRDLRSALQELVSGSCNATLPSSDPVLLVSRLSEKSSRVVELLTAERSYIDASGRLDPRFLITEYALEVNLRPTQVAIIQRFQRSAESKRSLVQQMIMGNVLNCRNLNNFGSI